MNDLALAQLHSLPALVDRASAALAGARSAAEVLDAQELASLAYDVAKRTARLTRAKDAYDELIAAAYRAQADALEIEGRAKRRIADEYDAAQDRGEAASAGGERSGREHSPAPPSAADLGLTRKQIHDARQVRDAEEADPGIVRRVLDERLAAKEEPTRAALNRAIGELHAAKKTLDEVRSRPKAPPPTAAEQERNKKIFGTQEDRAISQMVHEIVDYLDNLPSPEVSALMQSRG